MPEGMEHAAPGAAPDVGGPSKEERTMGMLAHLLGILSSLSVPGFVGPLIIWLVKKDESAFVADQAKEALNFQITLMIVGLALVILTVVTVFILSFVTFPLLVILGIVNVVFCILAGIKANEGVMYRYPFALRLIK